MVSPKSFDVRIRVAYGIRAILLTVATNSAVASSDKTSRSRGRAATHRLVSFVSQSPKLSKCLKLSKAPRSISTYGCA